jgi:hypothetical protein
MTHNNLMGGAVNHGCLVGASRSLGLVQHRAVLQGIVGAA